MASPPVIVNHYVVRAGASARAAAAGLAAYAGTRRGVVIEVSEADGRRLGVDGLAAYAANRTGSTGGLWGADGPVAVAEARRAIAQNGGAVLTTVVTVPNEIAPGAGLDRLDAWQALVRSEWPRLFSEMTCVPESRVEFYAAMHVNGTSHHVHILTVDREGGWDSLLPRGKMEAARLEISSKAMAPLLREAYIERDLAREAALDAVARIDRNRFDIELPPDGRIEAAHLRRFHPEVSAALREALDRAESDSPELAGALDRHRKAVERCAGLKCLTGEARDAYARKAAADVDLRCENAALRVLVPDRVPARENGALVIDAEGPMALASRDITETFLGPLLGLTSPEAEGAMLARALEGEVRNTVPAPVWRIPEKPKKPKGSPSGGKKRKVSAAPDGF